MDIEVFFLSSLGFITNDDKLRVVTKCLEPQMKL